MEELIKQINALAKKSKEEGLTEEEKVKQAELRQGMENTMNSVYIMDKNGNKRKVEKKSVRKI